MPWICPGTAPILLAATMFAPLYATRLHKVRNVSYIYGTTVAEPSGCPSNHPVVGPQRLFSPNPIHRTTRAFSYDWPRTPLA